MKTNFFFACLTSCVLSLISYCAVAQQGEWTWMKGDSTINSPGVFGTIGVPDSLNNPPGVYEAAEFQDSLGNFWLFGGLSTSGEYNTLWKYDLPLHQWTWVSGSNASLQPGSYGTQGVPSPTNHPGARAWGTATWSDEHGNFWLFGGYGYDATAQIGILNDLWNFNVSTSEWTWVSGSSQISATGVYGIQTVPDPANHPGGRCETNASWLDSANNLWLFGGYSLVGNLNDLWRFDRSTNEWTWMKGSSFIDQPGIYGTLGVANINNTPGARCAYTKWKDPAGNFWLFGGYAPIFGANFNDVWKYTVSSNEWTWMSGTNIPYDAGSVGPNCDPDVSNVPSSRFEGRAAWSDCAGHFWTFGGNSSGAFGDLWSFNSVTLEWTLVNGSSTLNLPGFYGVQGVSSSYTYPASRFGNPAWKDDSCNLWFFGGYGWSGYMNDLWKFQPDSSCPGNFSCMNNCNQQSSQVAFASTAQILCEKFCTDFIDSSLNNPFAWQWLFPGGDPSSSTNQNPTNICYDVPGIYDVTLITTSANGNDTLTLPDYITVYSTPPFPTITQVGFNLTSSVASSYQWQFNSTDIPGATNQSYTILQTGYYTVIVGDTNGCVNSFTVYVLISGINDVMSDENISIYPNQSSGSFIVEWLNGLMAGEVSIYIVNTLGQKVFSSFESRSIGTSSFKKEIDLTNVASGIYFIEIKSPQKIFSGKIMIAH